jgi:F0F1-type ATP synthase assembly protein I
MQPDDTLGRGMDVALVTLLFLGLGYLVDRWLGTQPVFMIVFSVVVLVCQFIRMRASYEIRMKELEAERRELATGSAR